MTFLLANFLALFASAAHAQKSGAWYWGDADGGGSISGPDLNALYAVIANPGVNDASIYTGYPQSRYRQDLDGNGSIGGPDANIMYPWLAGNYSNHPGTPDRLLLDGTTNLSVKIGDSVTLQAYALAPAAQGSALRTGLGVNFSITGGTCTTNAQIYGYNVAAGTTVNTWRNPSAYHYLPTRLAPDNGRVWVRLRGNSCTVGQTTIIKVYIPSDAHSGAPGQRFPSDLVAQLTPTNSTPVNFTITWNDCGNGICDTGENASNCPQDCPGTCGDGICNTSYESPATCPNDCPGTCGDGVCNSYAGETVSSCAIDCPGTCGDGICNSYAGETVSSCAIDCPGTCGDGICNSNFENVSTCPKDCPGTCGDGVCNSYAGETVSSCAIDCPGTCGDGICNSNFENVSTCPKDCPGTCGDGVCNSYAGETVSSCAIDCPGTCGDGICNSNFENVSTCPKDCPGTCGDGVCNSYAGETVSSCAIDCPGTCGDGICNSNFENVSSCPKDCPGTCGDGICNIYFEENFYCPQDCGPTYSISGTVSGAVKSGVTMTLTGAVSGTTTTDTNGDYSFAGLINGSYTVTPCLAGGYVFSPTSTPVMISGGNQAGINFTDTGAYSISGNVTFNSTGFSGVTVTLSGANSGTATTDANGNYSFAGLANGSYAITPGKSGFTFGPSSSPKTLSGANITGVNFTTATGLYTPEFGLAPAKGTNHVLVIMVNFSDTQPSFQKEDFSTLLFADTVNSMRGYLKQASYGQLDVIGDVVGWYQLSHPESYYANNEGGNEQASYPNNLWKLAEEAIDLAHQDGVDFSKYDNNGDGWVDSLIILHQGLDYQRTGDMHEIDTIQSTLTVGRGQTRYYDGVKIEYFSIVPEQRKPDPVSGAPRIDIFGSSALSYAYLLDMKMTISHYLYNLTTGYQLGVGLYDFLAYGFYAGPTLPSVFQKTHLGWLTPNIITADTVLTIPSVETHAFAAKVMTGPDPREYFLVTNQQRLGYDQQFPTQGLFIWHVDEQAYFQNMEASYNNDPRTATYPAGDNGLRHPLVMLEQADGLFNLENGVNLGDSTDAFGTGQEFSSTSLPASWKYDGLPSGLKISQISESDTVVTARIQLNQYQTDLVNPRLLVTDYGFAPDSPSDGDTDPYPEPGETLDFSVKLFNTGVPATGVNLQYSTTSPYLTALAFSSTYQSLAAGDSAYNQQPLVFMVSQTQASEVPAVIKLTITADSGYSTTRYLTITIGVPAVLIVDDDGGDKAEQKIMHELYPLSYTWDDWEVLEKGLPSVAEMLKHPVVLWLTGPVSNTPIDSTRLQVIESYLDAGGKLVLSSPYMLINPSPEISDFAHNYLHLDSWQDDGNCVRYLWGSTASPIFHDLNWTKTVYMNYLTIYPRTVGLTPKADATVVLKNDRKRATVIQYNQPGGYGVIFDSFGIEHLDYTFNDAHRRLLNGTEYQPGKPVITNAAPVSVQPRSYNTSLKLSGFNFSAATGFYFPEGGIDVLNKSYNPSDHSVTLSLNVKCNVHPGWQKIAAQNPGWPAVIYDRYYEVLGPAKPNHPPVAVATATPASGSPKIVFTLDATQSTDADHDPLTYEWTQLQGPVVTLLPSATAEVVSFHPDASYLGDYVFQLSVFDGMTISGDTVRISVNNHAPVAVATATPASGSRKIVFTLDATQSTDADHDPLTYEWTQLQGPVVTLLPSATAEVVSFHPDASYLGDYVFQLSVFDGTTISGDTVRISVNNHAPVPVLPATISGDIKQTVTIDASGSYDPDGDSFAFYWLELSGPATLTLNISNPAEPTAFATAPGNYVFQLTLDDGVTVSKAQVELILNDPNNHLPVAVIPALVIADSRDSNPVCIDGSASYDPDGNTVYYQWQLLSKPLGSAAVLSSTNTSSTCFMDDLPGDYVVQLRCSDYTGIWGVPAKTSIYSMTDDFDGDLMPDDWEIANGLNPEDPTDALLDPDGDGLTNVNEYFNGTNPNFAEPWLLTIKNLSAPWQGGFFGDADGNLVYGSTDVIALSALVSSGSTAGYRNVYPPNGDTHDFNGDGVVDAADLAILNELRLGNTADFTGAPETVTLLEPAGGETTVNIGTTFKIAVQVTDQHGTPRSGLAVIFEVLSGNATLLGGDGQSAARRLYHPLTELNHGGTNDAYPVFSADGLEVFYSVQVQGGSTNKFYEIYHATRGSVDEQFGAPVNMDVLSASSCDDSATSITADNLALYMFRLCYSVYPTAYTDSPSGLFVAYRSSRSASFSAPVPITELHSTGHFDYSPWISPDGLRIYYSSNRAGGLGGPDIWFASRSVVTDPFGAPQDLTEVNSSYGERYETLTADELQIVFWRNVSGNYQLFGSTRASKSQPFLAPQALQYVNHTGKIFSPFLSADGLTLYEADMETTNYDLFSITRPNLNIPFFINNNPGRFDLTGKMAASSDPNSSGRAFIFVKPTAAGDIKIAVSVGGDISRYLPQRGVDQLITIHAVP